MPTTKFNESQIYSGKPLAYLDQNILIYLTNYRNCELIKFFRDKFQVVYSEETLEEIHRPGSQKHDILQTLDLLKAEHLRYEVDTVSGPVPILSNRKVFDVYSDFCCNADEYKNIQKSFHSLIFKFVGGKLNLTFEQIIKGLDSELINLLDEEVDEEDEEDEILDSTYKTVIEGLKPLLQEASSELIKTLNTNIDDEENLTPIRDIQNAAQSGPKKLNNIKPPNVLKQIWEIYSQSQLYNEEKPSIEDFYNISPEKNFSNPETPYTLQEKISILYLMLNMLGYWPDDDFIKNKGFTRAMSDQSHASYARDTDILFSSDLRFVKKAAAIYEFLGINTLVWQVNIKKDRSEQSK